MDLCFAEELFYFPEDFIGQEDYTISGEKDATKTLGTLPGFEAARALIEKMGWGFGKVDNDALEDTRIRLLISIVNIDSNILVHLEL